MALGNVNGGTGVGICFDTMVIKTDTDEAVGFDVQYVDASELTGIASGIPVDVQGKAFLKFVVTAHVGEESANPFDGNVVFSPHGDRFQAIQDVKLPWIPGRPAGICRWRKRPSTDCCDAGSKPRPSRHCSDCASYRASLAGHRLVYTSSVYRQACFSLQTGLLCDTCYLNSPDRRIL